MFRVAICDDDPVICTEIEAIVAQYSREIDDCFEVVLFHTGEGLCSYVAHDSYFDLIFLDIEMPLMNGVEVGHKIREDMDNQTTQIVYVSAHESYYRELFDVRPMNFINKPITSVKITDTLSKAQTLSCKLKDTFSFKVGCDTIKLSYKDIMWFESVGRKTKLVGIGIDEYFYMGLDELEKEFARFRFMRIHRSYLINYHHVSRFRYTEVIMSNNVVIPISKSNQKSIRSLHMTWDSKG